jgi:DoxX-like family
MRLIEASALSSDRRVLSTTTFRSIEPLTPVSPSCCEPFSALGLVLPAALHIAPVLTPIAAVCLAVLMFGAVQTHRRLHESFVPALVLALVCVAIAAGWFRSHTVLAAMTSPAPRPGRTGPAPWLAALDNRPWLVWEAA